MKKWINVVLIVVQLFYLLGCASEEVKEPETEVKVKEISCSFNQLDGECNGIFGYDYREYKKFYTCSKGTCSEGDCENGQGTLSFPEGSKLIGNFKKGKLNGAGSYEGCGSRFTGIFKDNLKDKGVLVTEAKSYDGKNVIHYYDGKFQNEMRNGKGIYYSSEGKKNQIFEGNWQNGLKNGDFIVYRGFNGSFPISDKDLVLKSVYESSEKAKFTMDLYQAIFDYRKAEVECDRSVSEEYRNNSNNYSRFKSPQCMSFKKRYVDTDYHSYYDDEKFETVTEGYLEEDKYQLWEFKTQLKDPVKWSSFQGSKTYKEARDHCQSLKMRLPTISELDIALKSGISKSWRKNGSLYWAVNKNLGSDTPTYKVISLLGRDRDKKEESHKVESSVGVFCANVTEESAEIDVIRELVENNASESEIQKAREDLGARKFSEFQGELKWDDANKKCKSLKMRLPTVDELMKAYKSGVMISWEKGIYWSSEHYNTARCNYVDTFTGDVFHGGCYLAFSVRCRR